MRSIITSFLAYINNIGKENTDESSKRALAIYSTIVLSSYVVFKFTNRHNMEFVLGELLTASFAFLGVSAFEKHSANKHKHKKNEDN